MQLIRGIGAGWKTGNAAVAAAACMLALLLSCTPSPYLFTLSNSYTRDKFSGRDLGSHRIALYPLLTANGIIDGPEFPSGELSGVMRKSRPDLIFTGTDSVRSALAKALSDSANVAIQHALFEGKIALLQTEERFWRAIPADYLLVVRLRHGVDITTFNQRTHKRIVFEAELWDCSSMETAVRLNLIGTCDRSGYSDRAFLLEAFKNVATALPASEPSYDTKSW